MAEHTKTNLVDYHESETPHVFKWNERLALVQLSGFCVTLVTSADADSDITEVDETKRRHVTSFLETPASSLGSIRFGALSTWANRRTSKKHRDCTCDSCGWNCGHGQREWLPDYQVVLGAIYNRQVIREAMQWLYQHGVDSDAMIDVRSVPTPAPGCADWSTNHVLVMRCGDWTGIVMCCRPDVENGTDPLFPEVAS